MYYLVLHRPFTRTILDAKGPSKPFTFKYTFTYNFKIDCGKIELNFSLCNNSF